MYITLNDVIQDGHRRPFEIFINSKNMDHFAWTVALTRMISAVFRRGGDVSFVAEELKAVFDPRGGTWMDGRYVPSLLAAIGNVIERHFQKLGVMDVAIASSDASTAEIVEVAAVGDAQASTKPKGKRCPKCGMPGLIKKEGCEQCLECGHSKCG